MPRVLKQLQGAENALGIVTTHDLELANPKRTTAILLSFC